MRRLRVAIVGCGSITERGLLPHLMLERSRVEVTALCDASRVRLKYLAKRFHIEETYTRLSSLLRRSDAEALAIASPMPMHYEQAKDTLLAGRHVYVQKTMTRTAREARDLIRCAHNTGLTLAASPGQMALPAYIRAKEVVEDGGLGTVFVAIGLNMARGHEHEALRKGSSRLKPDPSWYYRPGGGPLRDMGVYSLHAITGILGHARRVTSFATRPLKVRRWNTKRIRVDVDDNVVLCLELERSRLATVCTTFSTTPAYLHWGHVAVSGSEGALEVRRLPQNPSRYELILRSVGAGKRERYRYGTGLGSRHDALDEAHVARDILDFVDAVSNSRPPRASAEHACHVIEIIEAAESAARTGSAQAIPKAPVRPVKVN